jgi:DNA-binding beta-propeller fold protein YncE
VAADFQLVMEAPTMTAQQGGAPQLQSVQATPINGFKGTINVSVTGLPSGVTTIPSTLSPITVVTGFEGSAFQVAASLNAALTTSTITVTGTSGAISHSVTFSVGVRQAAPFSIQLSPSSVSLTPGSATTATVTVTSNANPAPQLGVNVSSPPNLLQVSAGSPGMLISPTNPGSIPIQATVLAQPLQNFPVSVIASDNANNTAFVTLLLTVTVPFVSNTTPTRSTFARTDHSPTGIVYDPLRKLVFASVEILNEVVVLSPVDGHQIASIPVNFPGNIDVAADESAVYVVSPFLGGVTIIDPNLLQVVGHSDVPSSVSGSLEQAFSQVVALSNGKVLFTPEIGFAGFQPFYLWDPATNTFSKFGPSSLSIFGGLLTRSADHSKVVSFGETFGSQGFIYDVTTDTFSGPTPLLGGGAAISPDGSQIAASLSLSSPAQLVFLDRNLNQLASLPANAFFGGRLFYSLDGKRLYIVPEGLCGCNPVVSVIDTTTFSPLGVVPAFQFGANSIFSGFFGPLALDETGMLFGGSFQGVGFLDLGNPTFLREPLPGVFFSMKPSLASIFAPSAAQLSGSLAAGDTYNVFFGAPPASPQSLKASNVTFQSQNFLNLTIPAAGKAGPANATLTRTDGFFQVMPDAITYGPTILAVDGNAGPASGGSTITIIGYGLSRPNTEATIGGQPATITQQLPAILDLGRMLPIERMTVTTPAGTAGQGDVVVSTLAGSTTLPGGFHYLNSFAVHPAAGLLDAIVYDKLRQRLYISNQDHNRVEVFDLAANSFLTPLPAGNTPTALTITPDGALLAVLNQGDSTVSVIDLTAMTLKASFSLLTAADTSPGCIGEALNITAAAPHRVLADLVCTVNLFGGLFHLLNLDTGSLNCTGVAGCAANGTDINFQTGLAALASSGDGTKILLATSTGGGSALPAGILDLSANTLTTGSDIDASDAAFSSDGTVLAENFGLMDSGANRRGFTAIEAYADAGSQSFHNVFGEKLNPSGSLLFYPQDSGVDIFDTHTGRLLRHVVLPVTVPVNSGALAVDETGTKMFITTTTGIAIAQLDSAPLSIGHIDPVAGPSGTTITVRGSGFQNGATVTFGAAQAVATFIDASTLSAVAPTLAPGVVRISVKNPDGSQYSIDGAYTVN